MTLEKYKTKSSKKQPLPQETRVQEKALFGYSSSDSVSDSEDNSPCPEETTRRYSHRCGNRYVEPIGKNPSCSKSNDDEEISVVRKTPGGQTSGKTTVKELIRQQCTAPPEPISETSNPCVRKHFQIRNPVCPKKKVTIQESVAGRTSTATSRPIRERFVAHELIQYDDYWPTRGAISDIISHYATSRCDSG